MLFEPFLPICLQEYYDAIIGYRMAYDNAYSKGWADSTMHDLRKHDRSKNHGINNR